MQCEVAARDWNAIFSLLEINQVNVNSVAGVLVEVDSVAEVLVELYNLALNSRIKSLVNVIVYYFLGHFEIQ